MNTLERAARALQTAWDKGEDTLHLPPLTFTDTEATALILAVLKAIREPDDSVFEAFGIHRARMRRNWQDCIDHIIREGTSGEG
jgi:hypothetical protein